MIAMGVYYALMTTDRAVPPTVLELHKPDEPTWLPIKDAAAEVAKGESLSRVERRIRFWAKDAAKDGEAPVVRWKQEGPRNAPLLVALEDVQEACATRSEREAERVPESLPVPIEVLDDMRDMRTQLITAESARAKAETIVEFRDTQLADLKEALALERQRLAEATAPKRRWWQPG